ncbi:three prime repair exonuclease 2 [Podarcis lilfordi]|uniref:exodeoxyribonuclease III n=1 Tax=Podarcis lilfordi TaxID=74358 RepID=A0AA35LGW1_9SAUR|nr:three prime repair exonuclease 2 [Podarcis lilfordi]
MDALSRSRPGGAAALAPPAPSRREAGWPGLPQHVAFGFPAARLEKPAARRPESSLRLLGESGSRRSSAMAALQDFQTFVFLDLETTGLPHDRPRLAELCLFAVHRRSLQCSPLPGTPQLPRIIDKLTLCVDPQKPFTLEAERITGLSNQNLKENRKADFNSGVVDILKGFLCRQMGPVCLVAHNGLGFDFPLLRAELWRVGTDLPPSTGCLDTLPALKELERSPGMSYQLGALFRHFYGREPVRAHSAEGDVATLLLVFLAKAPELMTWAARNAQSWGAILPMHLLSRSRN